MNITHSAATLLQYRFCDFFLHQATSVAGQHRVKQLAKLYFRYSAMNAGKSTALLQVAHNYEEQGQNVFLYTAAIDHRYGVGKVTSRLGPQRDAATFEIGRAHV